MFLPTFAELDESYETFKKKRKINFRSNSFFKDKQKEVEVIIKMDKE